MAMPAKLRIAGLVKLARQVRQAQAAGMTPADCRQLKSHVQQSLEYVRQALAARRARPGDLPAPSQKALEYLAAVDFDRLAEPPAGAGAWVDGAFAFPGARRRLDDLLDRLARPDACPLGEIRRELLQFRHDLEYLLSLHRIQPHQLTDTTRRIRGWLGLLAESGALQRYQAAAALAARAAASQSRRRLQAVRVSFRPMSAVYRVQPTGRGRLAMDLALPLLACPADRLERLAAVAAGAAEDAAIVHEVAWLPEVRALAGQLADRAGRIDRPAGVHHDLAAVFQQVNARYFASRLPRPQLRWSRTLTQRKFGHFDALSDEIEISATLDRASVPVEAVQYVMYHEMLHADLGPRLAGRQMRVHHGEFLRAERAFHAYDFAVGVLNRLAGP